MIINIISIALFKKEKKKKTTRATVKSETAGEPAVKYTIVGAIPPSLSLCS